MATYRIRQLSIGGYYVLHLLLLPILFFVIVLIVKLAFVIGVGRAGFYLAAVPIACGVVLLSDYLTWRLATFPLWIELDDIGLRTVQPELSLLSLNPYWEVMWADIKYYDYIYYYKQYDKFRLILCNGQKLELAHTSSILRQRDDFDAFVQAFNQQLDRVNQERQRSSEARRHVKQTPPKSSSPPYYQQAEVTANEDAKLITPKPSFYESKTWTVLVIIGTLCWGWLFARGTFSFREGAIGANVLFLGLAGIYILFLLDKWRNKA